MPKLLLASLNPGKIREFRALLEAVPVELLTPFELGIDLDVEEAGKTYAENAESKARAFAARSGLLTLGDDSGLEVEALDGAPGLYSHRYAPQSEATDADRRLYLLQQLGDKPRPWRALFRCLVVLAEPGGETWFAEGICRGEIIPVERGENGFGYDPVFLLPEVGKTMAELSAEEKNQVSHRARAIQAAIPILLELLKQA